MNEYFTHKQNGNLLVTTTPNLEQIICSVDEGRMAYLGVTVDFITSKHEDGLTVYTVPAIEQTCYSLRTAIELTAVLFYGMVKADFDAKGWKIEDYTSAINDTGNVRIRYTSLGLVVEDLATGENMYFAKTPTIEQAETAMRHLFELHMLHPTRQRFSLDGLFFTLDENVRYIIRPTNLSDELTNPTPIKTYQLKSFDCFGENVIGGLVYNPLEAPQKRFYCTLYSLNNLVCYGETAQAALELAYILSILR